MADRDPLLDPYVMYLVVRKNLKMGVGKVASQCGHAVQMLMQEYLPDKHRSVTGEEYERHVATRLWLEEDFPKYTKIVLGADDDEFMKVQLENDHFFVVVDRKLATETVIGLWPILKSEASVTVKTLRPL